MRTYVLRDRVPVPVSLEEWASALPISRRVAESQIGGTYVRTVFRGIDHSFGDGHPLLFETMVFGGEILGAYCRRTSTWDQAVAEHKLACRVVADARGKIIPAFVTDVAILALGLLLVFWSVAR